MCRGEYAAAKLLARENLAPEREIVLENLTAITRAGATIILTYHLRDLLKNKWLVTERLKTGVSEKWCSAQGAFWPAA